MGLNCSVGVASSPATLSTSIELFQLIGLLSIIGSAQCTLYSWIYFAGAKNFDRQPAWTLNSCHDVVFMFCPNQIVGRSHGRQKRGINLDTRISNIVRKSCARVVEYSLTERVKEHITQIAENSGSLLPLITSSWAQLHPPPQFQNLSKVEG